MSGLVVQKSIAGRWNAKQGNVWKVPGPGCALKMKELQSLREALRSIPDPRTAKGRQYPLWTVLCVVALGLLSGCVHLSEIVRLGQRLSQAQRRGLGFRMRKNSRFYPAPGYTLPNKAIRLLYSQRFT